MSDPSAVPPPSATPSSISEDPKAWRAARAEASRAVRRGLASGNVDEVAQALRVLRQCLCVAPPPELRSKIIRQIRLAAKRMPGDEA